MTLDFDQEAPMATRSAKDACDLLDASFCRAITIGASPHPRQEDLL